MRPVQPGDTAVIVGMRKQVENNGAIVKVGPEIQPGDIGPCGRRVVCSIPGPVYEVTSLGRPLKLSEVYRETGRFSRYVYVQSRPLHSCYLVPLPPPEDVAAHDAQPVAVPKQQETCDASVPA